jgi:hypothetical protein
MAEHMARDPAQDIRLVMAQLTRAATEAVDCLPSGVRRAADLVRQLEIDTKLASQIMRLVKGSPEPAALAADVPGPKSARRLVELIRRRDPAVAGRLAAAFDAYEALVHRHARSRRSFVALANGLAGETAGAEATVEAEDDRQRREAFRANRHLLGRECSLQHVCCVMVDEPDGKFTVATSYLVDGLHRLRPDQPLHLVRMLHSDSDLGRPDVILAPLDPEHPLPTLNGEPPAASLLPRLCSKPLPQVLTEPDATGKPIYRLAGRGVGAARSARVTIGQKVQGMQDPFDDTHDPAFNVRVTVAAPVRRLILDVHVAARWAGDAKVRASARCYMPMLGFGDDSPDALRLGPVREPSDLLSSDELVREVIERLGWLSEGGGGLRSYRVEVEYPVLLSRTALRLEPGG